VVEEAVRGDDEGTFAPGTLAAEFVDVPAAGLLFEREGLDFVELQVIYLEEFDNPFVVKVH
jgi:hypothetical protein